MQQPAKAFTKGCGGWLFLLAVGAVYGLTSLFDPSLVSQALTMFESLLIRVVPVLALVFGLLFLSSLFLERKWLARHLGAASGVGGWALSIVCGILSVGPLYAWYPLLGQLKDKGVSSALIAAFLYSRALKLPLLPLMVHYFDAAYTVALSVCIVAFSVLSGMLMKKFDSND
jgi:uncharacterized membrane protein YraQ (UPF0718 family)